ncbi:hypothetical protein [Streptosporangium sp. NPDC004631]
MPQEPSRQENDSGPNISHSGNGDINYGPVTKIYTSSSDSEDSDTEGTTQALREKKRLKLIIGISAFALIMLGAILFPPDETAGFPEKSDRWPPLANRALIVSPVAQKLRSCAKEVVLQPLNCPQTVLSTPSPSKVKWRLHGAPEDGAMIAYGGGKFHVLGLAVMSVHYYDFTGEHLKILEIPYKAEVDFRDEKTSLIRLIALEKAPSGIAKSGIPLGSVDIVGAVRSALENCFLAQFSPMPPQCPSTSLTPVAEKAQWYLQGNPLLNAEQNFDKKTGIVHVSGSYAATVKAINWLGEQNYNQSGNYDALVVVDENSISVLAIKHVGL